MANSPEFTSKEFESINAIMGGAAPIGEVLIQRLLAKAGKYFFFQEGYGMTELSPVSHILPTHTRNNKIGINMHIDRENYSSVFCKIYMRV